MTSDTYDPLLSLAEERDRLERLLGADAAWRALKQLDALEVQGGIGLAASFLDLRLKLEAELRGNKVFEARQRITEAITLLSETRAAPADAPGAEGQPAVAVQPETDEPAAPAEPIQAAPRPLDRVVTIAAITQRGASAEIERSANAPLAAHAEPPDVPADDLTRIRGIDRSMAVTLRAIGVARFADIARWSAADVRRISAALGLGRTISRGNWIEQAARLAGGSWQAPAPAASSRPIAELVAGAARRILDRARPPSAPELAVPPATASEPVVPAVAIPVAAVDAVAPPARAPSPSEPPAGPRTSPPDDLSRLSAMDAAAIEGLFGLGVLHYGEIAGWTATDVRRVRRVLGAAVARRSGRWIEEAAILASGGETHHARRLAGLARIPLAAMPDPAATRRDPARAAHLAAESARLPLPVAAEPAPQITESLAQRTDLGAAVPAPAAAAAAPPDLELDVRVSPPEPLEPDSAGTAPTVADPTASAGVAAALAAGASPAPAPAAVDLDIQVLPPQPAEAARNAPSDVASDAAAAQPAAHPAMPQARPAPPIHPLEPLPVTDVAREADATPPAAPDPSDSAGPDPRLDPGHHPDGALITSLDDLPLDLVPDFPDISFGEADVAIVRRAPPPDAARDDHALRPKSTVGGAGTLQSRLRRAGEDTEIDGRTYAAYHGEVEEASVEIVRRTGPARPRGAAADRESDPPDPPAEGAATDADGRAVRRFLKALTGQSR